MLHEDLSHSADEPLRLGPGINVCDVSSLAFTVTFGNSSNWPLIILI